MKFFTRGFFWEVGDTGLRLPRPAFSGRFRSPGPPSACEILPMPDDWTWLLKTAHDEVAATLRALPPELRRHAEPLPVSYEPWPSDELVEDGLDPDLLGLFVGDGIDVADGEQSPLPRQVFLFLENLWDFAEGDPKTYREEVRITYIHEFGHYLGLDEDELEARGLL